MNYTLKLAIPLGLGLAAALVNMMVLKARTNAVTFIQAAEFIPLGQPFTLENLKELPLPGTQADLLKDTAIPYESLGTLLGQSALRDFEQGDIVFFRDFDLQGETLQLRPGEVAQPLAISGLDVPPKILRIGFELDFLMQLDPNAQAEWVGPLRVVSVGDRVANSIEGQGSGGSANVILVAVKLGPNGTESELQGKLKKFALLPVEGSDKLRDVRISTIKTKTE